MNPDFESSFKDVLAKEGGFVNDPDDHGGATNKGVTQKEYATYRIKKGLAVQSVELISDVELRDIYYTGYWVEAQCDKIPVLVNDIHFDTAVNCGPYRAACLLQESIGVVIDGHIGPKTLARLADMDQIAVIKAYVRKRVRFHINIVKSNATQLKFLESWINRTISFL